MSPFGGGGEFSAPQIVSPGGTPGSQGPAGPTGPQGPPGSGVAGAPIVRKFPFAYNTPGLSVPVGFTPATVPADSAPVLPLTILAATNDTFVFTGGGGGGSPETFTIAPGVYTTLAALAAAVAASTGSVSTEAFSTHVTTTHPSTVLVFTMVGDHGAADNGNTLTEGDGGAAAIGITTPPDTFAGGVSGTIPGAVLYTPTVGDILLDMWIQPTQAWNGTTPLGDIGTFDFGPLGYFFAAGAAVDFAFTNLTPLSSISCLLSGPPMADVRGFGYAVNPTANEGGGIYQVSGANVILTAQAVNNSERYLPCVFGSATPIKVCVSQDGTNTGADPGSTQGAAVLYLVTATPA